MDTLKYIKEAHNHQKDKFCSKCKEHKPLSEFDKCRRSKCGLQSRCKPCRKEYMNNMCGFKRWFERKKLNNNKQSGVEFTIEPEDIPGVKIEWYNFRRKGSKNNWRAIKYPKVCPVFGVELGWDVGGLNGNSPSLDRIDSTKGYIKGNVMMISHLANSMKQNATPEQLKQFSRHHLFGKNK